MEIQDFQIQSCFIIGIIFIFTFNQGFAEYISKAYFEKHEILDDSKFERFLKDGIFLGPCQIGQAKLNALDRYLIGEGSHRRLSSLIRLEESLEELFTHSCEAIFIEKLPSGVFADPFELQHLVQRGVFSEAAVFGDSNLELPSFRSNRSLVEVHMDISPDMFSKDLKQQMELKIELPLHARYQPLGHGFSRVEFGLPDICFRCSIEENLHNESCLLVPTYQSAKSQDDAIVWEVPCGNKKHSEIVSVVTFISAVLSAILIVSASVFYPNSAIGSNVKQS